MQRVRRSLARTEVERLRRELTARIPQENTNLPQVIRLMRLITRKSQTEYARLCRVAPRVLADIEAGKGNPRVGTLEKLLKPFGYRVGVVVQENSMDFRRPLRKLVTRAELNRILTREARKIEGYEDATLRVQYVYRDPDESGCNWSPDVMFNAGKNGLIADSVSSIGPIVRDARARYNIQE